MSFEFSFSAVFTFLITNPTWIKNVMVLFMLWPWQIQIARLLLHENSLMDIQVLSANSVIFAT